MAHRSTATGAMLFSVLCYSLVPLLLVTTEGQRLPFLFNSSYRLGAAIFAFVFLIIFFGDLLRNSKVRELVFLRLRRASIILVVIPYFGYTAFAISVNYIDISVTTIIREIWPLLFIIFTERLLRTQNRYRSITGTTVGLVLFGFAGFFFVILSQHGELVLSNILESKQWVGIGLAVLAGLIISTTAYNFKWAADLRKDLPAEITSNYDTRQLELFCLMTAFLIGSAASSLLNLAVGSVVESSTIFEVRTSLLLLGALVGGILLDAVGTVFNRTANLFTNDLGVNTLAYAIPPLALLWLFIFSESHLVRTDFIIVGASAILSANLLINFEAERLLGFKALVISLWACGTWVYLRSIDDWGWFGKSDAYFDVLFLSSTVFALILSFRAVRLANRTQEEDNRALKLFRELEELEHRGVIQERSSKHIVEMDEKEGRELEAAYVASRQAVIQALSMATGSDRERLRQIEVELDILAHSRQQGINFGEVCALFIFAGLVVATALLSRPADVQGLTGFLVEMFAMLFPAVIVFLTFNILDLQRNRVARILEEDPQHGWYGVAFQDTVHQGGAIRHSGRRTAEQWISVAVGVALIVAYASLLSQKWGVWPQVQNAISFLFS